jgi:ankyrin repeat protein/tRNA A-37 threonylcarbamoyl transferase component Bud32
LKINKHDDYERFLENLYQASMEKYLFSSPNGPTKRYLDVFDSLCYFYPRKVDEELKAHTTGEYGQKLIEGKFLNPEHRIQTHWGDMVSLYDEKENESELKNSYLKFSPNDTDETFSIGKIDNSEKYCEKIGKFVAVKKQNLNQLSQQQIDKIISEFEILHKMEYLELPRPHITETGEIYFFIKLYKGNPLISSLNAPTTIGLSQKLNYVEQLMMNLRCMHDKNILHLNITEENIVFEEKTDSYRKSMNARLIDFRESQIIPQGKDRVELNHFMENAPVEALAKHASVATDVYGLGLFIFKYLFSPDATCFLNTSPIQGIRDDLNYTAVSNFDKETKLTSKENYILQEMKKMILGMIATNESSRLPLDYCISQIQRFNHILSLPSQLPEFSLEEYCRIAGFQSFDLENPNILKHACEQNYFEIVKIILSDSNRKFYLLGSESNNLELLKKIIQHSDLELIKLLLTHGFFDWITVDGIFDLIHNTEETRNEKQRIFGLFFVYLYSKEHEFNFKDLKKHNNEGHTPLSKLMTIEPWDERSELLFNQLVIHGADINQKTLYDFDALFFLRNNVTIKNKSEVFKKLIKNGFLINEEHLKDKESPHDRFYLQIKTMHFIQSNKISGRNPSSLCFKSKHTALTLAAEFADNDMITCLLEFYMQESPDKDKSLILNQKNKSGETPLHTAILNKNFSTAYLLVINGADIHITDAIGNTAIDLIKNHTDTEDSMKLLNDINRHFQSKFYSIKIGNVVDKLLYYFHEKNFSALYLSYLNNESKLTAAMKNNFLKSIEKLNPTQSEIIQLINMGFSLSNIDETGSSFLNWIENKNQYLSKNLFLKELDLLNREGFNLYDINSINYMGHTPLSYAVFIQDINLIKTFIKEFKAEINAKNGAGNTALHLAVDTRNVEIINLLLSFGGDLTALNNNGLSPENLAWGNEFPEITQCFDNFKKNKKRIFLDPLQTKDDEHMETKRRRIT